MTEIQMEFSPKNPQIKNKKLAIRKVHQVFYFYENSVFFIHFPTFHERSHLFLYVIHTLLLLKTARLTCLFRTADVVQPVQGDLQRLPVAPQKDQDRQPEQQPVPAQDKNDARFRCRCPVLGQPRVTRSGGHGGRSWRHGLRSLSAMTSLNSAQCWKVVLNFFQSKNPLQHRWAS